MLGCTSAERDQSSTAGAEDRHYTVKRKRGKKSREKKKSGMDGVY